MLYFTLYSTHYIPICPSLQFGEATMLPPIQKNSSARREMEVLCHSFGDVMSPGVASLKGDGDREGQGELCFHGVGDPPRGGPGVGEARGEREWGAITGDGLLGVPLILGAQTSAC